MKPYTNIRALAVTMLTAVCALAANAMTRVEIQTTEGRIVVGLYDDTPLHRDNFVKLVREGYYDGLLFHRVISDFMVQTGDPDSRNAAPGAHLGSGGPDYEIDAEILCPTHVNTRGALAAARTGDQVNPMRRSSGSQFYIVTGRRIAPAQLDQMEQRHRMEQMREIFDSKAMAMRDSIIAMRRAGNVQGLEDLRASLDQEARQEAEANPFAYTPEQRDAYINRGGAPHLDGAYTVFGEVLEGMDVVERIEHVETDSQDRPVQDVRIISMKVLDN